MAPIQVALVGVGLSGQVFHAPPILALPELFNLKTVVERSPKSPRGTIGDKFNVDIKIVHSFQEALEDPAIELVVVGTPSSTHFEMAKAALQANKHVLIDKPITTTLLEALELANLAKTQKRLLCAFQNRRWDSDYLTLLKLISDDRLGDIIDFESHFDRYAPKLKGNWKDETRPGNGLVFDLGSHLIDQALQLFGRPDSLTAFTSRLRGGQLDDAFIIHFHYNERRPYPLNVTLRGHTLTIRNPQVRYIVRGSKGTYSKYGVDPQEQQLKDGLSILDKAIGVEPEAIHGTLENLSADGTIVSERIASVPGCYLDFYRNVFAAIRNGEPLAVKWMEAAQVIELIELAHRSAAEHTTLPLASVDFNL